jgi:hypothetical protein
MNSSFHKWKTLLDEVALAMADPITHYHLDREKWEVVATEDLEITVGKLAYQQRYLPIQRESREKKLAVVRLFIHKVKDEHARRWLEITLNNETPLENFRRAIAARPGLSRQWLRFRYEAYRSEAARWLAEAGISTVEAPPLSYRIRAARYVRV